MHFTKASKSPKRTLIISKSELMISIGKKRTFKIDFDSLLLFRTHSNLCGRLRIRGLTEKNPEIETFFTGEIIGKKYSFLTRKWDVDFGKDKSHWSKFEEFKCFKETFNNDDFDHSKVEESPALFMRWKEQFCLPDHRVKDIEGRCPK